MSFRLIFSILIASVLSSASAVSQVLGRPDTARIDVSFWSRHNLSKVAAAGLTGATLVYSWGVWWKNDFGSFKFRSDTGSILDAHLMIDKIGHFYTSYFMFRAIHRILLWGDHSKTDSFWWATGVSAIHGLAVEVGDGFSKFGFDHEDLLFNWAGVGYAMLQQKVPVLQNFQIKWSLYYPLSRHAFKINLLYDYHIYWLSARVNELLPQKWEP